MALCSRIKDDGARCGAQAIRGSEWCIGHDPEKAEARRRRASKGGKRGGRGRPQTELRDIKQRLLELADEVLAGEVNRGNAAVAGQLLNTAIRAVGMELKAREQEELVERIEQLETLLERQEGQRGYGT